MPQPAPFVIRRRTEAVGPLPESLSFRPPVATLEDMEDRLTELEIRYDHQADLVEQLNGRVTQLQKDLMQAELRIQRLEHTLEEVVKRVAPAPNEKPPHH